MRSASFASDLPRCSNQIYKAQYGDAIFVLLRRGTNMAAVYHRKHLELNCAIKATTLRS